MIDASKILAAPLPTERIIYAIKAVANGEADAEQQKDAFEFVLHQLAGADNQSFVPNDMSGGQNTAFLEGRRFVGRELRKIIITPSKTLLEANGRKTKVSNAG